MPIFYILLFVLSYLTASGANAANLPAVSLGESIWQAPGAAIQFRLTPVPADTLGLPKVYLCPDRSTGVDNKPDKLAEAGCGTPLPVQRLPASTAGEGFARYETFLPNIVFSDHPQKAVSYFSGLREWGFANCLVAHGWLRVELTDEKKQPNVNWLEIGLTSRKLSFALAVAFLCLAAKILMCFVRAYEANVGKQAAWSDYRSLPLRLIARSNNRASLSKLQVLIWTFVIAGGGVYVMTLNGSLMPLTGTALVLLGVTGATAVLSSAAENRGGARPSSIRPPGALQKVVANAVPESSDLIVQWTPSETGGPVSLYNVSWTQVVVGAQKPDAGSIVTRDNIVRLTRLVSKADYIVSVTATNPGGPSQAVASEKTTTNDGGGDFSDIPGQYSNNADDKLEVAEDKTSDTTIMLQRMPKDGTMLQYRRLDSEDLWTSVMYPQTSGEARLYSVSGLLSGVDYEFRVKVDDNGKWSKPITGLTRHTPQWADIVSEPERPTEIELTRVQMLIFTVSTAIFVSFKVADGGAIPDIPNEYIWLMGISNGVYLGNKWAR